MNNAFAPQPFESFEDDLDLDLGPPPSGDDASDHQPLQFTACETRLLTSSSWGAEVG